MNFQHSTISDHAALTGRPRVPGDYAFIALGANLASSHGDPAQTIRAAFQALTELTDDTLLVSSLWKSSPVDCPPGSPDFINAVAALVPRQGQGPHGLLGSLQQIELAFGRAQPGQRTRNAPRTLDLDIIDFCGQVLDNEVLTVPHPRVPERLFVLAPLAELAPDLKLGGTGNSVFTLKCALLCPDGFTRID